jgi:hypothetical protein
MGDSYPKCPYISGVYCDTGGKCVDGMFSSRFGVIRCKLFKLKGR